MPAGRQTSASVKDPDIVQPEKAALEYVMTLGIFSIDPPGEIKQELLKYPFQKNDILFPGPLFIEMIRLQRGPCVDWRVHIAQIPLICRQLAVWMHVPFTQEKDELFLGKISVDLRKGYTVECKVP